MINKKPKIILSVGALYYAFNIPSEDGSFDPHSYSEIIHSPILKKYATTPESESATVRASGQDYDQIDQISSIGLEFETVAFDPEDLAKAKGEKISSKGLASGGSSSQRPFLAIGVPIIKKGGGHTLKWYPKCKLTENTEEANTSESSFSEQNPTVNFTAYSFNDNNEKFKYVDTEFSNYPEGLTEEKFFSKVIVDDATLESVLSNKVAEENIEEVPEA